MISAQKKKDILLELENNRSKSEIAKKFGVSRNSLYIWEKEKNRQSKAGSENNGNYRRGKKHHRAVYPQAEKEVIRLIVAHPEWGCRKYALVLKSKGINLGYYGVNQLLNRLSANTYELRKNFSRNYVAPGRLQPDVKLEVARKAVEDKRGVSELSKEYNISRDTIYKWKQIYQKATARGDVGIKNFENNYVNGDNHPKAVYPKITENILEAVRNEPKLSAHELSKVFPVSVYTIWKILDRNNLNSYQQRLAYSEIGKEEVQKVSSETAWTDKPKIVTEQFLPSRAPAPPPTRSSIIKTFFASFIIVFLLSYGSASWVKLVVQTPNISVSIGLVFATIALVMGSFFFIYSIKYYITLAVVLSFSQQEGYIPEKEGEGRKKGFLSWILGMSKGNGNGNGKNGKSGPVGLEPNLEHVKLKRYPFISVQIPFYNEKRVVERSIIAATSFDYKGEYEVILCDDSTDETTGIIREYQRKHLAKGEYLKVVRNDKEGWELTAVEVRPGVTLKHLHRTSRSGFKGAALGLALTLVNPKTEFISVFDADFVPYPDTLQLFMKYFKVQNNMKEDYKGSNVAAVCGYQWHVLNKSENWITRGVRTEYAGSYVVERSGQEILGSMKLIHGSVYAIRRDALEAVGWETSITEDFELTLKLYNAGYKVVYTPYIQAPAECVSTLKRLIRQRMRWSEGHSFNVKKMFKKLVLNPHLTGMEKLEFMYLTPYYLQAFFFLAGTISWLLAETIFKARLPFWTVLWGWSLVLTNMLSLPLMNAVGLFLEEGEGKDYSGLASFILLSYIMVPFQAYASIKGFFEPKEGTWFRTPKTGVITDVFKRGSFYRFISGILPGKDGSNARLPVDSVQMNSSISKYMALQTANNQFNSFEIKPKRVGWIGKASLSLLLVITVTTYSFTRGVPEVLATNPDTTQYLTNDTTASLSNSWTLSGIDSGSDSQTSLTLPKGSTLQRYAYEPNVSGGSTPETACGDGNATGKGWIFDTPFEAGGNIGSGVWQFAFDESDSPNAQASGVLEVCAYRVTLSGGAITGSTLLFDTGGDGTWPSTDIIDNAR
ncbi:glycosyltransferase family 2 protein, partial [Patescibacteria group bacterium]